MIYLFKMVISLWESLVGNPQTHLGTKGSWESLVDSYENMGDSPANHIWLRGNDSDNHHQHHSDDYYYNGCNNQVASSK